MSAGSNPLKPIIFKTKLSFYDSTNMAQAVAVVTSLTNRAFIEMPPGTPPPIIIRFELVFVA
ncbi:hypothetical protein ACPPVU_20985 [Mucilaginibacter sp. McL0603]|uniref:hypothetical protein n=1 Tax=Mucilaginibacter sp. McL0603 TaxID=3415670 RepID=UPI003CF5C936